MGAYINPDNCEKEEWLNKNAETISEREFREFKFDNEKLPIVLINNGAFTAAGIAYCKKERDIFSHEDGRFKLYFSTDKEKLYEVSNLEIYLK